MRPTAAELDWARRVVAAAAEGAQGAVQVDGRMVDRPVVLKAQALLSRACSAAMPDSRPSRTPHKEAAHGRHHHRLPHLRQHLQHRRDAPRVVGREPYGASTSRSSARSRSCRVVSASSRRKPPTRSCATATSRKIDMDKLRAADRAHRLPDPRRRVAAQCAVPDKLGEYCHWGATTQDITDTATVLQIREGLALVDADLAAISAALATLARKHRDTPVVGRSNLQQAIPVTFGYKMATILAAVERHRERLDAAAAARAGRANSAARAARWRRSRRARWRRRRA